ncbi:hypothetical protein F5B20DRAFT_582711 [Whalleya microplaca]|nr:hypothetical protein F5B20DRAFT_582711 [Whalleya microplaca]
MYSLQVREQEASTTDDATAAQGSLVVAIFLSIFLPTTIISWTIIAVEHFRSRKKAEVVDVELGELEQEGNPSHSTQPQDPQVEAPRSSSPSTSQSSKSGTMTSSFDDDQNLVKRWFHWVARKVRRTVKKPAPGPAPGPAESDIQPGMGESQGLPNTPNSPPIHTSSPPRIPTPSHFVTSSPINDNGWSPVSASGHSHEDFDDLQHDDATSTMEQDKIEVMESHSPNPF